MLSLAGLTPPVSVVRSQSPGSSSLLPPLKALSSSLGSGACTTRSALWYGAQSVNSVVRA